jgi:dolichyl-phosphate beta-glucosyltransferase
MDFSIIIPVLNESHKIHRDIAAASLFLVNQSWHGEIIVVDDGSSDDTVDVAERAHVQPNVSLRIIRSEAHRGKGYAVRTGMIASSGRLVLFADSGLCIPYGDALRGIGLIDAYHCDIAHGSRHLPGSVIRHHHLRKRRISAQLFRWFIKMMPGLPSHLTDTQCGFKIYRGDIARTLFAQCITDGFMFDIEIILRATKNGYRIREFPVQWTADTDTRLPLAKTPLSMLAELYRIKKALGHEKAWRRGIDSLLK